MGLFTKRNTAGKADKKRFSSWLKRAANQAIVWDSALQAYEKADPDKQEAIIDAALRVGLLAAINPEKTKKVKSFISNSFDPASPSHPQNSTVSDRIRELKTLYENQLITTQEYETKKAEIIDQL
ncbi:MAG: SHOCT domain-containing protein [Verrucomicrobia bacterium]|nr:SHOCT domain-containing protein [Verrucomicrobiota bacterium]